MDRVEPATVDHEGATTTQRPPVITFPAESPADVVEMLDFIRVMEVKVARLRDEGSLPRAALTLPERLHPAASKLFGHLRAQAMEALGRAQPVVRCSVERSQGVDELIDWTAPRLELLDRLVRAGLITQSWERPFMMLNTFWRSMYRQVRGNDDGPGIGGPAIVITDQPRSAAPEGQRLLVTDS
jgi:hypothetical protein